jgi:O-antigen ligase
MNVAAPAVEQVALKPRALPRALIPTADALALGLLLYLFLRLWFDRHVLFDRPAAVVAGVGLAAAIAARAPLRSFLDWPLLAYSALTVLSIAAGWNASASAGGRLPWQPALHAIILPAYFYAATWILRTRVRIALILVILVVAVGLAGVEAAYDHVAAGIDTRLVGYPSTAPWMAYPDLALLFALALPVPLALFIVARSKIVVYAAAVMAVVFWVDQILLYSRSGYLSALSAFLAVAAVEIVSVRRARLLAVLVPCLAIIAFGVATSGSVNQLFRDLGGSYVYESRFGIWHRTLAMIGDHPLLGVGPGNYVAVMRSGYEWRTWFHVDDLHAHNMLLHVAAESGIPAAVAFLLIWAGLFRRLWLSATSPGPPCAVTIGVFGALVAFFVRCLTDHFMSGLPISDRVAFLLWTLIAAGVAATRLPERAR